MRYRYLLFLAASVVMFSCKKENGNPYPPPPTAPPAQPVLLKDLVLSSLPSPYYHFEYNAAGKPVFLSFASDLFRYTITYNGDRITEMRNNIIVNKDRVQYFYDNEGRVNLIRITDSLEVVFERDHFTYNGQKLIKIEREINPGSGFVTDRIMNFSYHPDGNLMEIKEVRPPVAGLPELVFTDRFEEYDNKINTDGFSLFKNEFFKHVFLLPGIQLQKNNPGKLIHTGGVNNFQVNYSYTYNDKNAPLERRGEFTFLNGPNAGQTIQLKSTYSYYD